jgi:hypothetical protein
VRSTGSSGGFAAWCGAETVNLCDQRGGERLRERGAAPPVQLPYLGEQLPRGQAQGARERRALHGNGSRRHAREQVRRQVVGETSGAVVAPRRFEPHAGRDAQDALLQPMLPVLVDRGGIVSATNDRRHVEVGLFVGETHGAATDEDGRGDALVLLQRVDQTTQQRIANRGAGHVLLAYHSTRERSNPGRAVPINRVVC